MSEKISLLYDPMVTIAEANNRKSKRWKNRQYRLSDLFGRLHDFVITKETQSEYFSWKNSKEGTEREKADAAKDVGGFVGGVLDGSGSRSKRTILSRCLLTLDIESGVKPFRLANGTSCCVYSTHSHTEEKPRFRIVAPLSRPITAGEYERLSRIYAWDVAGMLCMDPADIFTDDSTHQPERMMFWPSAPKDAPIYFDYADGDPIDVDKVLNSGRKEFHLNEKTSPAAFVMPDSLPDGSRTESLVKLLGSLQSKGLTDEAITAAVRAENTARCSPPLTERELQREVFPALTRWKKGDNPYFTEGFDPTDRTDMGQARAFIQWADGGIRYLGTRKNTGQWLVYNGFKWEANDNRAMREVQRFTSLQLQAARGLLDSARRALDAAQENGTGTEGEARARLKGAEGFHKFAIKYRGNSQVKATLAQAAPMVSITQEQLDADTNILNTPAGTIELQTCTLRENRAADYCTKATAVVPSAEGEQLWRDFLLQLTCGDKELMNYLQIMAGAFLYGSGKPEKLFIAHGSGGNGKSTFFNALSRVLGDYAVQVSSDWLVDHHNGTDYETVRLRGARLAQASELEEGKTINTALVKRVTSTDRLPANEKYRDVFDFIPTHSLVLHTNHLPAVRALDRGTWDRLVVIPFNARFRGEDGEKLGYDSFLFENAGGAILQWCIEGAKRFNDMGRRLPKCAVVDDATAGYMVDNDWLGAFLDACITMEPGAQITGIELHNLYQTYCTQAGERTRSRQELVSALRMRGIESRHTKKGALYNGMRRKEQSAAARALG